MIFTARHSPEDESRFHPKTPRSRRDLVSATASVLRARSTGAASSQITPCRSIMSGTTATMIWIAMRKMRRELRVFIACVPFWSSSKDFTLGDLEPLDNNIKRTMRHYKCVGILVVLVSGSVYDIRSLNGALCLVVITSKKSCLLYTSPSPRDVEESRMPSSA